MAQTAKDFLQQNWDSIEQRLTAGEKLETVLNSIASEKGYGGAATSLRQAYFKVKAGKTAGPAKPQLRARLGRNELAEASKAFALQLEGVRQKARARANAPACELILASNRKAISAATRDGVNASDLHGILLSLGVKATLKQVETFLLAQTTVEKVVDMTSTDIQPDALLAASSFDASQEQAAQEKAPTVVTVTPKPAIRIRGEQAKSQMQE